MMMMIATPIAKQRVQLAWLPVVTVTVVYVTASPISKQQLQQSWFESSLQEVVTQWLNGKLVF